MLERHEIVLKETRVTLINGDITKESVDALVNLNNPSLTQQFGISKVILEAGGTPLQDECKRKGAQPHGDVVMTDAGNLKCKKVIHVIRANAPNSITKAVKQVLKECDNNTLDSVAFPAIGTGVAKLDPKESLKSILKGIREYLTENISSVSQISIVTFSPDVFLEYVKVMKIEIETIKNPNLPFKVNETTVELVKGDITEQPVDCILNLTNSTLNQHIGISAAILSAAGPTVAAECKSIGTLTDGVVVTSGGNLKSKHIMHVIGPVRVSAFALSLEKILMECKAKSFKTIALPAIGTGIARIKPAESIDAILDGIDQCLAKINAAEMTKILIVAYDENVYNDFLKAFQARQSKRIQNKEINMKLLRAYIENPPNWSYMDEKNYKEENLHKDSAEFQNVENNFLKSANKSDIKITNIKRIQNPALWQQYAVRKFAVDHTYPNQENEKHLYHGTDDETISKIKGQGFNRSDPKPTDTSYGKGKYFSTDASYFCSEYKEEKHIYQAAVIAGKSCSSERDSVAPPPTEEDPNVLYNTTVDNVSDPRIFVVYNDNDAYPEYLISFKKSN